MSVPLAATQRIPDKAFSSNNPFRSSTFNRVASPFEDDRSDTISPPPRSSSVGSEAMSRPFSFMPLDDEERRASQYSTASSSLSARQRQTILFNDNNENAFARRQYNTTNTGNTTIRKSTNPFLEDMVSDQPMAQSPPPYKERAGAPPPRPPKESRPRGPGGPGNSSARLPPTSSVNAPPARPSASTKPTVQTRQRRSNSDSSVIEPRERERRERREREREHRREREGDKKTTGGSKSKSSKHRTSKKKVHTDTIDKLDVTGIFGPGSFHHDGPFDACNPHRNKNTKRAPVKAFPVDGANMTINGGSELRSKYATEDQILGRNQDDAYNDFNQASRRSNYTSTPRDTDNTGRFDASAKSDPVHGVATWGLGSTTFLDGAPASRDAIAQSAEDDKAALGRKKSLVQRLRGTNGQGPAVPRRAPPVLRGGDDQIYRTASNPDTTFEKPGINWDKELAKPRIEEKDAPPAPGGLLRRVKSLKVGRTRRSS